MTKIKDKSKVLVIGAGISGATIARLLADSPLLDFDVEVIEKQNEVGGVCQDEIKKNAYLQKHGAHIFHTNEYKVWEFLNRFCKWMPYQHKVLGCIDGSLVPIPFNINSVEKLFPKSMIDSLSENLEYGSSYTLKELSDIKNHSTRFLSTFIFENVFKNYSLKQWFKVPDDDVLNRVKAFRFSRDDRYFQDDYQGIPQCGYTELIKRILNHKDITVQLNTDITIDKIDFDRYVGVFYTGPVDYLLNYRFGALHYKTCKFEKHFYTGRYLQREAAVINYPNDYEFTRTFDCSWFMPNCSNSYFIKEYPKDFDKDSTSEIRYYPGYYKNAKEIYNDYCRFSNHFYPNLFFAGRLGSFSYLDMDKAILQGMDVALNFVTTEYIKRYPSIIKPTNK